jgi:hypothetical protein
MHLKFKTTFWIIFYKFKSDIILNKSEVFFLKFLLYFYSANLISKKSIFRNLFSKFIFLSLNQLRELYDFYIYNNTGNTFTNTIIKAVQNKIKFNYNEFH